MNIQDKIEALETEFAEKIEALKAEGQRDQEFPKDYDEYWYIDSDGDILNDEWGGFDSEEGMLKIGNVFKTKEQAEFAVEKLKVEAELRKYSKPFEHGGNNYTFNYYHDTETIVTLLASACYQDPGAFYFAGEVEAQQAIETVGIDRIKKYIFGVED